MKLVIQLQPSNQSFREFYILLKSLTQLKRKMGRYYYKDFPLKSIKKQANDKAPQQPPAKKPVVHAPKVKEADKIETKHVDVVKDSSDDEDFKKEMKQLTLEDENLRNLKILRERSSFRSGTDDLIDKKMSQVYIQVKEEYTKTSLNQKTSSINLENSREFESILKEFYELK